MRPVVAWDPTAPFHVPYKYVKTFIWREKKKKYTKGGGSYCIVQKTNYSIFIRSFSLSLSYDLWQRCGEMKYAVEKEMVKSHCVRMTAVLKASPGRLSSRKIMRCMRSFSASSSRVWIQPSHHPPITLSYQQQPRQSSYQTSRYVQRGESQSSFWRKSIVSCRVTVAGYELLEILIQRGFFL